MPMPYQYNPYQSYFQQFPNYQQQMSQPPMQPTPPQQQQPSGMIWVSSQMEAESYLMAPNSAVTLWDSNSATVYLKQTDASGKPTMKIYDLVERARTPVAPIPAVPNNGITREEFDELAARVNELTAKRVKPVKKEADE